MAAQSCDITGRDVSRNVAGWSPSISKQTAVQNRGTVTQAGTAQPMAISGAVGGSLLPRHTADAAWPPSHVL